MYILKTNGSGDYEWDKAPGTGYPNTARFLLQTHDGGFLYGGFKNIVPTRPPMPLTCPNLFPHLWDTVNAKFPLARSLIDAARRKGTDPSLIEVMELEYANAEEARDVCDLESAQMHLDWIIQVAVPEYYSLAAILILPVYTAWRRRASVAWRLGIDRRPDYEYANIEG
jgi:hypothetical protein